MTDKPKYTIEFISTAGNYFLKKDGDIIALDPNFEDGKELLKRLNCHDELLDALQKIVSYQYDPSKTLAQLNGIVSNAKDVLKKLES